MLSLISWICWSIRYISLAILNFTNNLFFQNEYLTPIFHYSILATAILLPLMVMLLWFCLAVDEWCMEEDSRGSLRRMLHEAEEARKREETDRMVRKER
mmetsp:Transcript_34433/g.83308  ORF Transcript_34433/g.83308 Transcript_34433/m.83308 type:complete len:99 (+) Transcript_34433:278-574(+)